jgi:hypothetical protein
MKVLRSSVITWVITIVFVAGLVVRHSDAQMPSAKTSNEIIRDRIAKIFQETFKQGETRIEVNGQWIMAKTFMPPTTEHVEEIRQYGDEAIPILSDYLSRGNGWEKYLAMRFLGSIGGKNIIDPVRRVALHDPEPSLRTDALLWLSAARWDLAAPIIKQAARKDSSPEVRKQAQAILAEH